MKFRPEAVKKDLSGRRFGKLLVLGYAGHDKYSHSYWDARCDCGATPTICSSRLSGQKSCGCAKPPTGNKNELWGGYGEISGRLYSKIRRDAIRRGLEFDVSIEWLWSRFLKQNRKCALTGWDIKFAATSSNKDDAAGRTASLDRIDSALGYSKTNLQWVHKRANFFKSAMPEPELFEFVESIAKHRRLA